MLDINGFIRQVVFNVGYHWFRKTGDFSCWISMISLDRLSHVGISCWISMVSLDRWSHVGYQWFHKTSGISCWVSLVS